MQVASERITRLGQAFPDDGDMAVSVPKTKVMQVEELEKVKVTEEDVAKATEQGKLPFQCEFCFRRFATKVDQRHYKHCGPAQRVVWDGEWEVAKILDVRGSVDERWYLVEWDGEWEHDQCSWSPWFDLREGSREGRRVLVGEPSP